MIFVFGLPRSGTTWLAKILDSHPDTFYLHEPDIVLPPDGVPMVCEDADLESLLPAAQGYVARLTAVRTSKTLGALPLFRSRHEGPGSFALRQSVILAVKAAEAARPLRPHLRRLTLPTFGADRGATRLVLKSVNAMGRVNLFRRARAGSRMVVLLRHPCGQIASVMRGERRHAFESDTAAADDTGILRQLAASSVGRRYGLELEALRRLTPEERLAWEWLVLTEKAITDANGDIVLRYEDLCRDPIGESRALFAGLGLGWDPATERFIRATISKDRANHYYSIFRNPQAAAERWRKDLPPDHVRRIMNVVERSEPCRAAWTSTTETRGQKEKVI